MPKHMYNPAAIEPKWQSIWEKRETFRTPDDPKAWEGKPKFYILGMFPYVSGAGLHVGHPKGYLATDVIANMRRMQGYNVLHPMGGMRLDCQRSVPLNAGMFTLQQSPKRWWICSANRSSGSASHMIGAGRLTPPRPNTTSGRSGFSSNSTRKGWHTSKMYPLIGVLRLELFSPTRRLKTENTLRPAIRLRGGRCGNGC